MVHPHFLPASNNLSQWTTPHLWHRQLGIMIIIQHSKSRLEVLIARLRFPEKNPWKVFPTKDVPPGKPTMAMENPPFEDVFPIENGDFPSSHVGFQGFSNPKKKQKLLMILSPLAVSNGTQSSSSKSYAGLLGCHHHLLPIFGLRCPKAIQLAPPMRWGRSTRYIGDGRPPNFNDGNPYNGAL